MTRCACARRHSNPTIAVVRVAPWLTIPRCATSGTSGRAENALFFVDDTVDYKKPDAARFWARGGQDLDNLLSVVGARVTPEDDVVEIGCGVGRLTHVLAARARHVHALDVSPRMLELASEHGGHLTNVEWILGDGASLAPLTDASADACVSHAVFQHIPDPAITLGYVREIGRVLRPGGWAAFRSRTTQGSTDGEEVRRPSGSAGARSEAVARAADECCMARLSRRARRAARRRSPRGNESGVHHWGGDAVLLRAHASVALTDMVVSGPDPNPTCAKGATCAFASRRYKT